MVMKTGKVILLLSYMSIASASAAMLTPALPHIETVFSLGHGQVEWVMNIFLIGYTLGQLFYGPLANRVGRLGALRIGFSINVLGIVLCLLGSYSKHYDWLLIGRFVTALGASAGLSCTFILLNESLTQSRAKHALSYAVVSFTAGIGIAVLLGGLLTQYWEWQGCFWLLLTHGIWALYSVNFLSETLIKKSSLSLLKLFSGYGKALLNTRLWVYSLLVGLVSLFSYCYSAAAPIIAHDQFDLLPAAYGYYNTLNMAGMLLGAFAAASLLKRYNNIWLLLASAGALLLLLILLAVLVYIDSLTIVRFFSVTAACYFMASIIFPAASHVASNAIADRANAAGSMNLINMGSAVIGVGIMGYLPMSMLWALISVTIAFATLSLLIVFVYQARA
jgi:DHA1 family bicyclomycin/chloramphenicol resistance-like MFS transporter